MDCLAWLQHHFLKTLQLFGRLRNRIRRGHAQIELHYFCPLAAARIGNVEVHSYAGLVLAVERDPARRDLQTFIGKAGIRKAVAKGKKRSNSLGIIMAVTDEDPFGVVRDAADARSILLSQVVFVSFYVRRNRA